jgi:hypothetical protein
MGFFDQFLTPPPPPPPRSRGYRPDWVKPEAALAAVVPVELVLARSEEAVVAVSAIAAYPTGFEFAMTIISRQDYPYGLGSGLHPHWPPHRPGAAQADDLFRLAVVFADGRVGTNIDVEHAPPIGPMAGRAVLMQGGGGGGGRRYDMTYWVYPLPPPGPLAFVCEWPALGLTEARVEIDAQLILDAAARSVQIWPENDEPDPDAPVASLSLRSEPGQSYGLSYGPGQEHRPL